MSFAAAERVADAILYEGYLLYPYRPSAPKNQIRWQFGVVAPRSPRDDGERWFTQTECLVEPVGRGRLSIRIRCLRPQRPAAPQEGTGLGRRRPLEGVPQAIDVARVELGGRPLIQEVLTSLSGVAVRVGIAVENVDAFTKVRVRVENQEPWQAPFSADRDAMLQRSLVAAHLLLALDDAAFVSLLEPPATARATASGCANQHTWPVLAGDRGRRDLMLSSPIILYDYPAVARESPGDLFDAAEIDELLSLRVLTLTDDEKREAREADPCARRLIDRVDDLTPEALSALHGTMRSADFFNPPGTPSPDEARAIVQGVPIGRGDRVRLRPMRRADAMDMFLRDQAATVAGVYRDVDDRVYVAVTVDADPAAALHESFGRFFYFDPAELELVTAREEKS